MAIGTTAAILGGSALLAGGSALSSSKANSAAKQASADATATARENNALTREIYGKNEATLSPFVQTGTAAGALLNDFYGIQPAAQPVAPTYTPPAQTPYTPTGGFGGMVGTISRIIARRNGWGEFDNNEPAPAPVATVAPKADSRSAFANYITNSDYAFQQQEGGNKVNSGYAGAGTVQSGAAMRALEKYRQNLQSGYRGEWAGGVANQQGVGLTAAGALAGVSTNFGNTIAASNTAASNARANAALSQQSVFGNALGTAGGALMKGFG